MNLQRFKLKIKRAETPFYRVVKRILVEAVRSNLPLPRLMKPVLRGCYEIHFLILLLFRRLRIYLYYEPLFRSRCASVGTNLNLYNELPYIDGHVDIHIGNHVTITIGVNQSVVIEDDVLIATNCRITDNDGHPRDAELRARNAPIGLRDIKPVIIRRHAWIGNSSQIMKGVTIGEGAIIGANSVVISNIPDYCIAMGNPAEVLFRNIGRAKVVERSGIAEQADAS